MSALSSEVMDLEDTRGQDGFASCVLVLTRRRD
jgi:hypothetical protein